MHAILRPFAILALVLIFTSSDTEAYYPLGCFYENEGQGHAIVGVKKGKPYAIIDKDEKRVQPIEVSFNRLEVYGQGYVSIIESSAYFIDSGLRSITVDHDGRNPPGRAFVDLEFEATEDLVDCYALVFSGPKAGMSATNLDELFISFHAIGKVEKEKSYKETFPILAVSGPRTRREQGYFIVFYDRGMPLRSDYDEAIADHFLNRNKIEHNYYLEQYLENNTGNNLKHEKFIAYTPYLPEKIYQKTGTVDAKIMIQIYPDGRTEVESIEGLDHPEATTFIKDRISEWLFFPAIQNGDPVSIKTAFRLQY